MYNIKRGVCYICVTQRRPVLHCVTYNLSLYHTYILTTLTSSTDWLTWKFWKGSPCVCCNTKRARLWSKLFKRTMCCWFCLGAKQMAGLCIRTSGTCWNILGSDRKRKLFSCAEKEKKHSPYFDMVLKISNMFCIVKKIKQQYWTMSTSSGCWRRTTSIDLWPFMCLYFFMSSFCFSLASSFALGFHFPRCTNSKTDKVRTSL